MSRYFATVPLLAFLLSHAAFAQTNAGPGGGPPQPAPPSPHSQMRGQFPAYPAPTADLFGNYRSPYAKTFPNGTLDLRDYGGSGGVEPRDHPAGAQ